MKHKDATTKKPEAELIRTMLLFKNPNIMFVRFVYSDDHLADLPIRVIHEPAFRIVFKDELKQIKRNKLLSIQIPIDSVLSDNIYAMVHPEYKPELFKGLVAKKARGIYAQQKQQIETLSTLLKNIIESHGMDDFEAAIQAGALYLKRDNDIVNETVT